VYKPKPVKGRLIKEKTLKAVMSVKCGNSISQTRCYNSYKPKPIKAYQPKQKGGIINEKLPRAVKTIKTTKAIKTKKTSKANKRTLQKILFA